MSKIGYVRVSTVDQNTDRQEIALSELGIKRFFIEKISGKNTERPEFKKMMEYIREGDTLYIGVQPTFPTKPPLRHKMDKYCITHPL